MVVSNQTAVGQGYVTAETVGAVNDRMASLLWVSGVELDGVYCRYHSPGAVLPEHRTDQPETKPSPAMLYAAAEDLNLDLSTSFMVGDREKRRGSGTQRRLPRVPACEDGFRLGSACRIDARTRGIRGRRSRRRRGLDPGAEMMAGFRVRSIWLVLIPAAAAAGIVAVVLTRYARELDRLIGDGPEGAAAAGLPPILHRVADSLSATDLAGLLARQFVPPDRSDLSSGFKRTGYALLMARKYEKRKPPGFLFRPDSLPFSSKDPRAGLRGRRPGLLRRTSGPDDRGAKPSCCSILPVFPMRRRR